MIDINQELELSRSEYEPRKIKLDGDHISVQLFHLGENYSHGTHYFCPKTGVGQSWLGQENPVRLRPKSQTRPVDHFYIQAGGRDWTKEQWVRASEFDFSTGKDAADKSKELNAKAAATNSPYRFRVDKQVEMSKVLDYPSWMEFRFSTGEYKPVPWANEPWAIPNHFAHLSLADEFKVAFVADDRDGQRDEMTVMTPGKYLKKYYDAVLTDKDIQTWAVKVDVDVELKFAATPDEIYDVYTRPNSPSSCMRYMDHSTCHDGIPWRSGESPVRIYGAGDLAVAYLERRGKIVARTLVWPAKKAAGRSYGDLERIRAALAAEGYQFDAEGDGMNDQPRGLLNGARLTLIDHGGTITMPYMDYQYRASKRGDDLVMMQGGEIFAQTTCGVTDFSGDAPHFDEDDDDGYDTNCDRCEDGINYDDTYNVWRRGRELSWCSSCYSSHSTSCDYCDESQVSDTIVQIYDATDGSAHCDACQDCVENNSEIQYDHTGRLIDTGTAQCCDECDTYFSADAEACPNTNCVTEEVEA